MIWPKHFFTFDADDGGAGGGGNETPPAAPETPAPAAPAVLQSPVVETPAVETPVETPAVIKMTPAQLDERLKRAKGGERESLAKSLGFDGVEALQAAVEAGKNALEAQRAAEEAQKTAEQRQAEALSKALEKAQALERKAAEATAERDRVAIRAAAVEKMAGKFIDPGAAFVLLDKSQLKLDGEEVSGLDDAIRALETKHPWTLASKAEPQARKIEPKVTPNPEGGPAASKESDADRRARYFGDGVQSGFFRGGGVRPESNRPATK